MVAYRVTIRTPVIGLGQVATDAEARTELGRSQARPTSLADLTFVRQRLVFSQVGAGAAAPLQ